MVYSFELFHQIQKKGKSDLPLSPSYLLIGSHDGPLIQCASRVGFFFWLQQVGGNCKGHELTQIHRLAFVVDIVESGVRSDALLLFTVKLKHCL